jgi:hypothetical protein
MLSKVRKLSQFLWFSNVSLLALLCSVSCRDNASQAKATKEPPGISVVQDSLLKTVNVDQLRAMRWADITPTVESCTRSGMSMETLKVSESLTEDPVIYLRGLLHFSLGNADAARQEWAKLDPSRIPADYLYPAWRLEDSMSRGVVGETPNNPYEVHLAKAVDQEEASALVRARFHAAKMAWRKSLDAYLLTNPATWTPHDVQVFQSMELQAGYSRDVKVILAGALNGGQVRESLQTDLARLIKEDPVLDREVVESALKSSSALAQAALEGTSRSLALRQAFASNQFQKVIELASSVDPVNATDEMVLFAFLSAAQTRQQAEMDRWSRELLRRNPSDRNSSWIKKIKQEAR